MAEQLERAPEDGELLEKLRACVELVYNLPFDVSLRKIQDIFYGLMRDAYPGFRKKAQQGDETAGQWTGSFETMIDRLKIRLAPEPSPGAGQSEGE